MKMKIIPISFLLCLPAPTVATLERDGGISRDVIQNDRALSVKTKSSKEAKRALEVVDTKSSEAEFGRDVLQNDRALSVKTKSSKEAKRALENEHVVDTKLSDEAKRFLRG